MSMMNGSQRPLASAVTFEHATGPYTTHGTESTFRDAIRLALRSALEQDPHVCLLGQDIGDPLGGVYGVTQGLSDQFGTDRIIDMPLTTSALVGAAVGMALMGLRPVVEIQSMDYLPLAFDQLAHMAGPMYWRSGGTLPVPLVVRGPTGGGTHGGPWRSSTPEAWLAHTPGLKVVMPATPFDAYGLLKAAIRDNNPVLFLEPRYLYRRLSETLPDEDFEVPIGPAEIRRFGSDLTMVTYGSMLYAVMEAAETVQQSHDLSCEVIDLRTLAPLDLPAMAESVAHTHRLLIVHQDMRNGGLGAEIAARIAEEAFHQLAAPIMRITSPDLPYPAASDLEAAYLPGVREISAACVRLADVAP